jgi:hypothetical protein
MNKKIIYLLDLSTREFLGEDFAYKDPLEPGNFHRPENSSFIKPPAPAVNEIAVHVEATDSWIVEPDFRGQTFYDRDTGAEVKIDARGALPVNLVAKKPLPTPAQLASMLAENKTAALAVIDQWHTTTVQQLAGNPTQIEKDTWAMKLAAANAVAAGAVVSGEGNAFMTANGLTTPSLQAAWAAKVLANAAKFAGLVGALDAVRTKTKSAIIASAEQTALDAALLDNKAVELAAIAALTKV